jgi:hypothetical protein
MPFAKVISFDVFIFMFFDVFVFTFWLLQRAPAPPREVAISSWSFARLLLPSTVASARTHSWSGFRELRSPEASLSAGPSVPVRLRAIAQEIGRNLSVRVRNGRVAAEVMAS